MLYAGTTEYPELPQCENVQVRSISREVDLAWLAGIIDGEGNIDYSVQAKKHGNAVMTYFCPKLRITNTDMRMIRKISEIYVDHNITFFYALNSVNRYKNRKPTWRNQLEITISAQRSMLKLLPMVIPYLVNKKRLGQLMVETLTWVANQPYRGAQHREGVNYTLKDDFKAMIAAMKEERQFYIDPSTTARKAREVLA